MRQKNENSKAQRLIVLNRKELLGRRPHRRRRSYRRCNSCYGKSLSPSTASVKTALSCTKTRCWVIVSHPTVGYTQVQVTNRPELDATARPSARYANCQPRVRKLQRSHRSTHSCSISLCLSNRVALERQRPRTTRGPWDSSRRGNAYRAWSPCG